MEESLESFYTLFALLLENGVYLKVFEKVSTVPLILIKHFLIKFDSDKKIMFDTQAPSIDDMADHIHRTKTPIFINFIVRLLRVLIKNTQNV